MGIWDLKKKKNGKGGGPLTPEVPRGELLYLDSMNFPGIFLREKRSNDFRDNAGVNKMMRADAVRRQ